MTLILAAIDKKGSFVAFSDIMISRNTMGKVDAGKVPLFANPGITLESAAVKMSSKAFMSGNYLFLWSGSALHAYAAMKVLGSLSHLPPVELHDAAIKDAIFQKCDVIYSFHDGHSVLLGGLGEGVFSPEWHEPRIACAGSGSAKLFTEASFKADPIPDVGPYTLAKIINFIGAEFKGLNHDLSTAFGGGWEIFALNKESGFRRVSYSFNFFVPISSKLLSHVKSISCVSHGDNLLYVTSNAQNGSAEYCSVFNVVSPFGSEMPRRRDIDWDFDIELEVCIALGQKGFRILSNSFGASVFSFDLKSSFRAKNGEDTRITLNVSQEFIDWQRKVSKLLFSAERG